MTTEAVARALARATAVLEKRPSAGLHDDAPGLAVWRGGVATVTRHPSGFEAPTDMPGDLGGAGEGVSPGWMVRAGLAACTTTLIAMVAAEEGVKLETLEVRADSRSDTRGALGMTEADGSAVYPGPHDGLTMHVWISAPGVSSERLQALVEKANRRAPMSAALRDAQVLDLRITTGDA